LTFFDLQSYLLLCEKETSNNKRWFGLTGSLLVTRLFN